MIIGLRRDQVIHNIQTAVEEQDFYRKVEVDDPDPTPEERLKIISHHLQMKNTIRYKVGNRIARIFTWFLTRTINWNTEIRGLNQIKKIKGGAVITSNHFSPWDNMVVRRAITKAFHRRMYIVSQDTNLAMNGFVGFLMKYTDVIPINNSVKYMQKYFNPTIKDMLEDGKKILIYPEQEMWFNYRKPRPPKRGAYYYAAANLVPVISCFVEIRTLPDKESKEFYKTQFVMHILPPIYPDPDKNISENSRYMMDRDYQQKKEAYEKAYGKPLTYDFEKGDIAGWVPGEQEIS